MIKLKIGNFLELEIDETIAVILVTVAGLLLMGLVAIIFGS